MNCLIKVLNENSGLQVTIPYRSVTEQMGEYFVYQIGDNVVNQKRVILGPSVGGMVVVKSGLQPGDKIVVDGIQKLHEGLAVAVSKPDQEGNKPNTVMGQN